MKFLKLIPALTLCFFCTYCFSQSWTHTPKYVSMTANSNGYYEYLPEGYNPAGIQKYPLILFLHGAGDIGNGSATELPRLLMVGIPKLINEGNFPVSFTVNGVVSKFIIISPQFISQVTDAAGEAAAVTDVHNILNYIGQNYKIDLNRVYLTGLSMGGGSTFNLSLIHI